MGLFKCHPSQGWCVLAQGHNVSFQVKCAGFTADRMFSLGKNRLGLILVVDILILKSNFLEWVNGALISRRPDGKLNVGFA